jgi:hypothetical protein
MSALVLTIHAAASWKHCLRRVYACPGEACEELPSDRRPCRRRRTDSEELRADATSGGRLAKDSNQRRARKADFECRFVDGRWKRPERAFLRRASRPISGKNLRPKSWPLPAFYVGMCAKYILAHVSEVIDSKNRPNRQNCLNHETEVHGGYTESGVMESRLNCLPPRVHQLGPGVDPWEASIANSFQSAEAKQSESRWS